MTSSPEALERTGPGEAASPDSERRGGPSLAVSLVGLVVLVGAAPIGMVAAIGPGSAVIPVLVTGGVAIAAGIVGVLVVSAPLRRLRRKVTRALEEHGVPARLADGGSETGVLQRGVDILLTDLAERAALLHELAAIDSLTGLQNRVAAFDRLRHSIRLAERDHLPLSVALVDVDGLGSINEERGETVGDRVLESVAHRLQQMLRGSDWAARWEDDAFLLALFSGIDGSRIALERLLQDISDMKLVIGDLEVRCTVSIGAVRALHEDRVLDVVQRVSATLERAQDAGPGALVVGD